MTYRPSWMNAFEARNISTSVSENEHKARNAFNKDLGTIVHSNFFKRLSHKTQVYSLPSNDHVHTRLTHSIEASQIGRQIARYFCRNVIWKMEFAEADYKFKLCAEIEELTAAACLAHDIGHSAFGHVGKMTIESFCLEKGEIHRFDDNKQVVRVFLNKMWMEKLNPSGPLVASVLKKVAIEQNCYESELDELKGIINKLNLENARHPVSIFMEAADDIAYLSADFQDFLEYYSGSGKRDAESKFGILEKLKCKTNSGDDEINSLKYYLDQALKSGRGSDIQDFSDKFIKCSLDHVFGVIDDFSTSFFTEKNSLEDLPKLFTNYLLENASGEPNSLDMNLLYSKANTSRGESFFSLKKIIYKGTILKENFIQEQDRLARVILRGILEELYRLKGTKGLEKVEVFSKLPEDIQKYIEEANADQTLFPAIIDFASGMTDRYAVALWKEIVDVSALDRLNPRVFRKAV